MSLVNDYLNSEAEAKALNERLEAMKNDPAVQKELAFKEQVVALMEEYDKSVDDVLFMLNPQAVYKTTTKTGKRKPRCMKVYRNPHTDEVIKTRGGNHNGLKAWKAEYGADTVEGWVEQVIDQAA